MRTNHFSGFREFAEPWQRAVKRQFGAQDTTNPPQIVTNAVTITHNGQKKLIRGGTTIYKVTPDDPADDTRDPKKSSVTIRIGSPADDKDPLMPATGHGQPSPFAGQTFTITRELYNYMIQPGPGPAAAQAATAAAGGADPTAQAPAPPA
jgi:hypothetical protein